MKQTVFLLMACMALLLSSCSTMRKSTATSMAVESGVYQYPTVADLEVKDKVTRQVSWRFRVIKCGQPSLEVRRANLVADLLKEAGADVLLEPQVTFVKHPFGDRVLTVTGFPAVFKNFRKATAQDLEALKVVVPPSERKVYNVSAPWYKRFFKARH